MMKRLQQFMRVFAFRTLPMACMMVALGTGLVLASLYAHRYGSLLRAPAWPLFTAVLLAASVRLARGVKRG